MNITPTTQAQPTRVNSAIYEGWVRHRRLGPRQHSFKYRTFMLYLRLDELPGLFDNCAGWSARRPALARFRRSDFLGDPEQPLEEAVRDRVEAAWGTRPQGPVCLLANLRYFGFIMNPISCYYCFGADGQTLEYIVAEVTNTPWKERHSYVLKAAADRRWLRAEFAKALHVSPFHPMDMTYHWHSNRPGEKLHIHLENHQPGGKVFDATLSLQRHPLEPRRLRRLLWRYPLLTVKVGLAIYYEALKLWLKGVPYHPHPPATAEPGHE